MFFGRKPKPDDDLPFQAVVRPAAPVDADARDAAEQEMTASAEDGWSADDIEAAYLRALEAAEVMAAPSGEFEAEAEAAFDDGVPADEEFFPAEGDCVAPEVPPEIPFVPEPAPIDEPLRVSPWQIVEALLFVGGRPLTSRQIADVLGGSTTPEAADDHIASLNAEYARQQRPYEVRLTEGGYRLVLKPEFEKVRARVFGIGPREVKLAQNALEVLALVAYQQPVSRADVEESGIQGAAGLLRQLLRRELIVLHRGTDGDPDTYRTTDRFLELFGLRSLSDLPRPEAVNLR